ncbi:MAG TPA: winged helix DNA-binding domain-containing protein [Candidatus Limnocylindrales bacterium]|nr:winged helix DNA-binding domain-containing protein [Candidatus Limnocylindrales bacterium]
MSPSPTLTEGQLNRATLARQMLLERERLDAIEAVERLVALQAQEPASPYIALHTRLDGFRAAELDAAFRERRAVKGHLMRVTLHALSARDFGHFWPAMAPSMRAWRERQAKRLGLEVDLDAMVARAQRFARTPRTGPEIRAHLPQLPEHVAGPGIQRDAWWAVRIQAPFLMVPDDVPWSFGRRPLFIAAGAWLDGEPFASEHDGLDHLVRRYLRAFGPASLGDMAQFTGIQVARLRPSLERLLAELRTFRDERGRQLYDVADGRLPPADTPAPARFLPMWDSVLLAYQDRTRMLSEPHRRRVIQKNGDFLPAFLVDGVVAGLWRADRTEDGRTSIRWQPFEPLSSAAEEELASEAERLAAFVEPLEPAVYRRYATTWMDRAAR